MVDKDQWQNEGRSLRGNVDRNPLVSLIDLKYPSRSLRGNVDRNTSSFDFTDINFSRSLRGNVDRNTIAEYWT